MSFPRVSVAAGLALGLLVWTACAPAQPSPTAPPSKPAASLVAKEAAKPEPSPAASPADWEKDWNALVEAARREGKVVFSGSPIQELRAPLPAAFKQRFGVEMEYLGLRTAELVSRLKAERAAGQYSLDVLIGGIPTVAIEFYDPKIIDPLRPALIHPEATDPRKWKPGKLLFFDPEEQHVLRLLNSVRPFLAVNTSGVSLDELRSVQDLLNPKFKGKIAADDPTVAGGGANATAYLYVALGEDFIKQLFVDQQVRLTRDRRELGDWLARGTYPIALGAVSQIFPEQLVKEGFPIQVFAGFPDAPGYVSSGTGLMVLMNRAPNPNAAKLLVNWLASKEGLEIYSRGENNVSLRTDVDESWAPDYMSPKPGVQYFDSTTREFGVDRSRELSARIRAMLGQ